MKKFIFVLDITVTKMKANSILEQNVTKCWSCTENRNQNNFCCSIRLLGCSRSSVENRECVLDLNKELTEERLYLKGLGNFKDTDKIRSED